jgi:hypothetical protein
MKPFRPLSTVQQLAAHLRAEIASGRLSGTMPGVIRLVEELGVGTKTAVGAMEELMRERLIVSQGPGRSSRIVELEKGACRQMRVSVLLFNKGDETGRDALHLMQHLHMTRHHPEFASRSLWSLRMDARRVASFVECNPADAWVVIAASREILQWFADQPFPCFALLGGFRGMNLAGAKPDKLAAQREAVRRLVELGHRRIVKLVLKDRIHPVLGQMEKSFLEDLESHGIATSPYNLPAWGENPAMFYERLDLLFRQTPPTALFLDAVSLFHAARDYLAQKGFVAPRDVSLICADPDLSFEWMQPSVAHIHWPFEPLARAVVRWLDNVASGKDDRRQTLPAAKFVKGGTIGPVPDGSALRIP